MAADRELTSRRRWFGAALAAVLAAGAVAELAASDATATLRLCDFAVGAAFCVAAGGMVRVSRAGATASLLAAATWFAGTFSADASLAYRGPVVALLLVAPRARRPGRLEWGVIGAACIAGLLPPAAGEPASAVTAALAAALVGDAGRRAPADRRRAAAWSCAALLVLAALWTAAAAGGAGTDLLLVNEAVLIACAGIALASARGVLGRRAAGPFVVELPAAAGRPVTAQVARALADPELEIRYELPGGGWVDETGRATEAPEADPRRMTPAKAPGGGSVTLLHGTAATVEGRLARAAAAAAVLALDNARLQAEIRARAADVRASRRRLLTVADAERRALAERLESGPRARLQRIRRLAAQRNGAIVAEIDAASAELTALGRGLYPPSIARHRLREALLEMAARSPVPTQIELDGELHELGDDLQAAIWFLCSEALANVARHSGASQAVVRVKADHAGVAVEISDDGAGGARAERGLRGLMDRIEARGGSLRLDSPPGGPTVLRAVLPVA